MSASLAIAIKIGAAAGAALSVFSNLKGRMQAVAAATAVLKQKQKELDKEIKNGANLSAAALQRLREQYAQQQRQLERLRAATRADGDGGQVSPGGLAVQANPALAGG
jgi:uncharacterized protein HemX